ncbi:hypothetical protein AGABI2DRAFT_186655 [Agaricus bisporus var. bisporus H97]|uniref:hypothetical protein n=1 Tax=Agaricus bisporus var. bisporus (strain H97 / ATCC MYA-4626 / FGSC 10389) TaxID=936046 RepID=UPI00029F7D72|nr:hypothetical protein AGABI2DRAFT_186655 [Agaricus bisporus var. bisporus H97]EKV45972.1 hypothetical protein AGABI2DRAFT_186655 [Agaricus bisporus var. bisporus H97]
MSLNREKIVGWPNPIPFNRQSVIVPGTKRPGQTAIWGLIDENTPNTFLTLDQIFEDGLKVGREREFLGHRSIISTNPLKFADRYEWITYGEVDKKRRYIGSAMHSLFSQDEVGGGEYQTVGIWSANRPEWQIIDIATQSYEKVSVSLYETLGKDVIPCLKLIIVIDKVSVENAKLFAEWGQSNGIKVQEWDEFEAYGMANLIEPIRPTPETVASICYTSGTTDTPKGAVLKHKALAISIACQLYGLHMPDNATLLSYLPLAHIYERMCEFIIMALGGRIGYFSGDPLRLLEDAQILKPHFFPSAAMAAGNVPGLKGKIFRKAVETKLENFRATGKITHPLWDNIVFRKIQNVLGGRVQLISSAAAPINTEILNFLKIAFACEFIEENMAACTKTWPDDRTASGLVGPPTPVTEIKLVDVPDMGYTSEDKPNPRGELCMRGLCQFTEYYKDPKNTRETIDEEGWLHSGDVGEIDYAGRFKIIDRVKNIMKLAQGEYVALEKVESLMCSHPFIAQIFIYGDSFQSYLIAIVVPDPIALAQIASRIFGRNIAPEDQVGLQEAIKDVRLNTNILKELTKHGQSVGLKGFEMIKRIHLTLTLFSIDNDALTPTMKYKRKNVAKLYQTEIAHLYSLGEPSSNNTSSQSRI